MIPVPVCRNLDRHRLKVQKVHKVDEPMWEQWQDGLNDERHQKTLSELPSFIFLAYEKGPKNVKLKHLNRNLMHTGPTLYVQYRVFLESLQQFNSRDVGRCQQIGVEFWEKRTLLPKNQSPVSTCANAANLVILNWPLVKSRHPIVFLNSYQLLNKGI